MEVDKLPIDHGDDKSDWSFGEGRFQILAKPQFPELRGNWKLLVR